VVLEVRLLSIQSVPLPEVLQVVNPQTVELEVSEVVETLTFEEVQV
jgi:hypothetical protein